METENNNFEQYVEDFNQWLDSVNNNNTKQLKRLKRLKRKQLIIEILSKSFDEFESKEDFISLAMKTKKQLRKKLLCINNYPQY